MSSKKTLLMTHKHSNYRAGERSEVQSARPTSTSRKEGQTHVSNGLSHDSCIFILTSSRIDLLADLTVLVTRSLEAKERLNMTVVFAAGDRMQGARR